MAPDPHPDAVAAREQAVAALASAMHDTFRMGFHPLAGCLQAPSWKRQAADVIAALRLDPAACRAVAAAITPGIDDMVAAAFDAVGSTCVGIVAEPDFPCKEPAVTIRNDGSPDRPWFRPLCAVHVALPPAAAPEVEE